MNPTSSVENWYRDCRRYDHRGHEIVYRYQPGDGTPTVLIHGFPTASWDWHRVWPRLRDLAPLIALDLLGFGHSAKPRGRYAIFAQADLVASLCAELGCARAHLLAHDYGDTVAQELLARQGGECPLTVDSCYLLNGGIVPGYHRPTLVQTLLASPVGHLVARAMTRNRFDRTFSGIFGPATRPDGDDLDACWELIEHGRGRRVIAAVSRYQQQRRQYCERWVGALADAAVPVRVLIGARDPISGVHMVAPIKQRAPRATVKVLPEIGHYPQLEAPAEVAADYLAFRHSPAAAHGRTSV